MWPTNLTKNSAKPPVSILTPTYNRKRFIPTLIQCILAQDYPRDRMEWVVLDDSSEPVYDIIKPFEHIINIRYIRSDEKLTIGAKRNRLHREARGDILVNMDDDDYYSTDRIKHAVQVLLSKKVGIVGSTRNFIYYTDDKTIWECGPYGLNHATFGTMAYTKNYALSHTCDETVAFAEEIQFTNSYKESLAQLDPMKVMIVIAHKENTFNKDKLRYEVNPNFRKTSMKLKTFIPNKEIRDFYAFA